MRRRREDENGAQEVVELAALADGTLAPERRAALEAQSGGVVGAHRPTRRATAGGHAHAECGGRDGGTGGSAGTHRGSATWAPLRSAASSARDRSLCGRRAGGRHGTERVRFRRLSRAIPRRACFDCAPSRRQGRRETHKDIVGLADRARRHRDSPDSRTGATTRHGCATPPAYSFPSGRSTRAERSRSGPACRRLTSRPSASRASGPTAISRRRARRCSSELIDTGDSG